MKTIGISKGEARASPFVFLSFCLFVFFAPIGRATANGGFYGITFTVKKKQEVVLGFQVDLTAGSPTQEFRADEVKLLNYGN
jgi:hypothetical protein